MDTSPVFVIIVCLALTVPIAIGGAYFVLKILYGNDIGKQLAPANFISAALILLAGVGAVGLIFLIGWPDSETMRVVIWLVIVASVGIAAISAFRRRPAMGEIVLELEPRLKVPNWIIGLLVGTGIVILILSLASAGTSLATLLGGLGILSWGVWYYLQNKNKTRFTETGIYVGATNIKWESIKAFHWLPSKSAETAVLHLQIKGWLSLLSTHIMRIPAQHKDAIDDLLIRYTSGGGQQ